MIECFIFVTKFPTSFYVSNFLNDRFSRMKVYGYLTQTIELKAIIKGIYRHANEIYLGLTKRRGNLSYIIPFISPISK